MAEPTVLVVDDDPVVRRLLQLAFETEGFTVHLASDGVEGLEQTHEVRPDVIVLDIMMPRKDGLAMTGELRADPATKDIPVMLLSAKANSLDVELGLKAGADDYVTKPCEPYDLIARARRLIEGGRTKAHSG